MSKLTIFQREYMISRIREEGEKAGCHPNYINILCDKIVLIDNITHEQFEHVLDSIDDYIVHNGTVGESNETD